MFGCANALIGRFNSNPISFNAPCFGMITCLIGRLNRHPNRFNAPLLDMHVLIGQFGSHTNSFNAPCFAVRLLIGSLNSHPNSFNAPLLRMITFQIGGFNIFCCTTFHDSAFFFRKMVWRHVLGLFSTTPITNLRLCGIFCKMVDLTEDMFC